MIEKPETIAIDVPTRMDSDDLGDVRPVNRVTVDESRWRCVSLKNLEICSDDGSGQVGDVDADFAIRVACQTACSRDQGGGCSARLERASALQLLELVVTPLSGRGALKIQII